MSDTLFYRNGCPGIGFLRGKRALKTSQCMARVPGPKNPDLRPGRGNQTGQVCLVEKLRGSNDHDVVGDGHESHLASAIVIPTRRESGALMLFEHEHDRFHLPALAVQFVIECRGHQEPPGIAGQRVGRSTMHGGNQRLNAVRLAQQPMVVLRVVATVGEKSIRHDVGAHALKHRLQLIDIRARSQAPMRGQDQVGVAIDDDAELGESSIRRRLPEIRGSAAASDEVAAGSIQHEAGRVRGRDVDPVAQENGMIRSRLIGKEQRDRLCDQPADERIGEQTSFDLLQRREVRRLREAQEFPPQRPVIENRDDAAVIGAKEFPQHETREELGELIIVTAEPMAVGWQRPVADGDRNHRHPPW